MSRSDRHGPRLSATPDNPADLDDPVSPSLAPALRVMVTLVAQAAADLQDTHERTGMSKTDIVNRAISLYAFFEAEAKAGNELFVRRDGQAFLIKLL